MKTMRALPTRFLLLAAGVLAAAGAHAQTDSTVQGPALPPALRSQGPSTTPATSGEALRSEALQKLRRRFEEAELDGDGKLSEDEAKRAGLGFIAGNFAEIDTAKAGKVSFDDVRKFMQQRRK